MELSESQDSKDSDGAGIELIDTSDSDNKGNLGGSWDVDLSIGLGLSSGVGFLLLSFGIISFILLNSLEEILTLGFVGFSALFPLLFESGSNFLISLLFFLLGLRFGWNFV